MKEIREIILLLRSKISHNSSVEISWVVIGQVFSVVAGFILLKILSSLGKEDFGLYALIITIALLLGLIFYGPLQQGFIKFYYSYLDENLSKYFVRFIYKALFIASFVFLIVVAIFFSLSLSFDFNQPPLLIFIAGIYIITFKFSEFFNALLNLLRKRKENALLQGIEKITIIFILSLFLYINELNLIIVFISMALITSGFAVLKITLLNRNLPAEKPMVNPDVKAINKTIKKQLIAYTSPFLIWGISAWLQLNGEKWIINGYLSTSDVGVYAIMMAIVNGLIMIPSNIVWEISAPLIYKNFADLNKTENINTGSNYIKINVLIVSAITLSAFILTYFTGRELIIIISNDSYTSFWFLLPLLCLGYGLFLTGQSQTTLGLALNLPRKYLGAKISSGIISVGLNFLLISKYGLSGVAYSSLIVGIYYVFYISVVNKTIRNKIAVISK